MKFDISSNVNKNEFEFENYSLNELVSKENEFAKSLQKLYSKKQFKQMEVLSLEFKNKFTKSPNPEYFLGLSYYEQNRFEEAISVFKNALSKQVNENILNNLGLVHLKINKLDEAITILSNALK